MARPAARAGRCDRAGAARGDRGDPGHDRPRGPGVRPPARGRLRRGDPHRRQRGAPPVRRADPRSRRGPRLRTRRLRRAGPRGAPGGTDPRLAPVRLPRGRPGRLAARLRGGRRARVDAEQLGLLAEAIFAYIDELSADSVEGYAAGAARAGGRAPAPPPRAARPAAPRPTGGRPGDPRRRRRRRGGGSRGAPRPSLWPRPISRGSGAASRPTRWSPPWAGWAARSSRAATRGGSSSGRPGR